MKVNSSEENGEEGMAFHSKGKQNQLPMLDHMSIEEVIWSCDSLKQLRRHIKVVFCQQRSSDGSRMEVRLLDHGSASQLLCSWLAWSIEVVMLARGELLQNFVLWSVLVIYGERQLLFLASCINGEVVFGAISGQRRGWRPRLHSGDGSGRS